MRKPKRVFRSIVLFAAAGLILMFGFSEEVVCQKFRLVFTTASNAFGISGYNIRKIGDDSILADINLNNLTGTWYFVTNFSDKKKSQIPDAFLMGPYQIREFKDVQLSDKEVLEFELSMTEPAAYAMLGIDMFCRGIFTREYSPEEFDSLFAGVAIETFKTAGKELGDIKTSSLMACITAAADKDVTEAIESCARFAFNTKEFKKRLWGLIKIVRGEKDSVIATISAAKAVKEVLDKVFKVLNC